MYRLALVSLGLLLLSFKAGFCETDDVSSLKGKAYGSFMFFEEVPNALFFEDKITENDSFYFRKAIRNHNIDTIVLDSPGGSIWEGLSIAGMIFDKELTTYVPSAGRCASACAFMFFAGRNRQASGKLGVHQFYSDNDKKTGKIATVEFGSQFTVSEIIGFLNEFGTPPFVFEKIFAQKEMYYFTENEIRKLNSINDDEVSLASFTVIENFMKKAIQILKDKEALALKVPNGKPKPDRKSEKPVTNEIQKFIQGELNRIGCSLGKVDGIIGPASKRALATFNKNNKSNFDTKAFFSSAYYYKILQKKPKGFCPKIITKPKVKPKPEALGDDIVTLSCIFNDYAGAGFSSAHRDWAFPPVQTHILNFSKMTSYFSKGRVYDFTAERNGSVTKNTSRRIKWKYPGKYGGLSFTFIPQSNIVVGRDGTDSVRGKCSAQ